MSQPREASSNNGLAGNFWISVCKTAGQGGQEDQDFNRTVQSAVNNIESTKHIQTAYLVRLLLFSQQAQQTKTCCALTINPICSSLCWPWHEPSQHQRRQAQYC